ncbi:serine/threonine protein kinase [bacterium]|nr:serine/threonine protein kinase [bacterium]
MIFGKRIGDYELIGKINKGGMAEIHKARHIGNETVYAIRIMLPGISMTSRNIKQFLGGADVAKRLSHPNIVEIVDIVLDKELPYVVMEYVDGNNLKHCLLHREPIITEGPLDILMQVACGLQYLHGNKIIHRDIKPENILVSSEGNVKIADFSLAVRKDKDQLVSRAISGSRSYIAPERVLQGRYDERADIYSLGITAYELLTGRLPYLGKSDQEVLSKHVNERVRPKPICRFNPSVPRELEEIVMTCVQTNPAHRYPDVGLIIRDLEGVQLRSDSARDRGTLFPEAQDEQ